MQSSRYAMQMWMKMMIRESGGRELQDMLGENNPWASSQAPAVGQPKLSCLLYVVPLVSSGRSIQWCQYAVVKECSAVGIWCSMLSCQHTIPRHRLKHRQRARLSFEQLSSSMKYASSWALAETWKILSSCNAACQLYKEMDPVFSEASINGVWVQYPMLSVSSSLRKQHPMGSCINVVNNLVHCNQKE